MQLWHFNQVDCTTEVAFSGFWYSVALAVDFAWLIVELEQEDREGATGEVKIEFTIQWCGLSIFPT